MADEHHQCFNPSACDQHGPFVPLASLDADPSDPDLPTFPAWDMDAIKAVVYEDRPAWVLTTERALQLRDALEEANAQTDEEYLAVIAKLWPDISFEAIEAGFRWAIDSDPVGIDPEPT